MFTNSTTFAIDDYNTDCEWFEAWIKGVILKPERMPMPPDTDDDQKEPPEAIAAACVLPEGECVDNVFASEYSLT